MEILVINLDRAQSRLQHMRDVFDRAGLAFTRLSAIDGRTLGSITSTHREEGRALSAGEVACFMSHRLCWQKIAAGDASHGVVMEDDVVLSSNAARLLGSDDWIPADADIVKIETYRSHTRMAAKGQQLDNGRSLNRLFSAHLGAGGYIIAKEAAAKLVQLSKQIDLQVDDFLFDPRYAPFKTLSIFQVTPAICIQGLRVGGEEALGVFKSDLYEERLLSRPKLTAFDKVRREARSALFKGWRGIVSTIVNLAGKERAGKIPFE